MPESEGKLLFADNLNLSEGKTVMHSCRCFYSENPLVDLLESEDAGE